MISLNDRIANCAKEEFDIIILAGQSNAWGCGIGEVKREFVPDARILMLCDDANAHFEKDEHGEDYLFIPSVVNKSITIAAEREKTGNFALIFAQKYLESGRLEAGRKILIINAAVGGTGFAKKQWGIGAPLYDRLCDMTKAALNLNGKNRVVTILWHQGEHDAFENSSFSDDERYAFYHSSISAMFKDYIKRFSLDGIPVVAGGFCGEWYEKYKNNCDIVIKATKAFLAENNGGFAESVGLLSNNEKNHNGDDIHFCREALYILGERFYLIFEEISNEKQDERGEN